MGCRMRKLAGTILVLLYVPVYTSLALALAQVRPIREGSLLIQILCFAGLGTVWILPLLPLIRWMQKPDA
ncbi:MAG: DUF2842 domain-containing protein [Methylocapsa sp.]|nr:DUF2842 domain-containing protein [Methylocapsa sp.]